LHSGRIDSQTKRVLSKLTLEEVSELKSLIIKIRHLRKNKLKAAYEAYKEKTDRPVSLNSFIIKQALNILELIDQIDHILEPKM